MTTPGYSLTPVVRFNGRELSQEWLNSLIELRIEMQYQVPSRVSLRFTDPEYQLVQSPHAALGVEVEVRAPVPSSASMVTAEIVSISSEQHPGQPPELVLVGLDLSHRLGRTTRVKVYNQQSYSDIVTSLASESSLTPAVHSSGAPVEYLMQAESDMALLNELAARTGFDWWVTGKKLHFARPEAGETVTLRLGEDLLSFSARASGLKPSEVQVDGWDRSGQKAVTSTASSVSAPVASSDFAHLADKSSSIGESKLKVSGLAPHQAGEATHLAQAVLNRVVSAAVTAKGLAEGNPGIALGKKAKVEHAGPLSGDYPITEVEHVYRPARGFQTRFVSGERRPTTLVDTLSGTGAAVPVGYAGPAHARAGLTVGQVTSNNDPEKRGRVKVRFPGMTSDSETTWARVVSVGGGAKRGAVWIPEVDDEVLVGFEGGDARQPVVIGGLFGEVSTMPTTQVEGGKVQARGMTSRLGHSVLLLDGEGPAKQAIVMSLSGEAANVIHLGKDKLSLKVPEGTPVEIVAGGSSVKISDSGDIAMKAVNVTIQADAALKLKAAKVSIEAETTFEAKAQGIASVSALETLDLKGTATAKLAGGVVMIN